MSSTNVDARGRERVTKVQRYLSLSPFLRVDKSERGGPFLSPSAFSLFRREITRGHKEFRERGEDDKIDPCVVRSVFAVLYPPTHCTEQMAAVGGGRGIKGKTPSCPSFLFEGPNSRRILILLPPFSLLLPPPPFIAAPAAAARRGIGENGRDLLLAFA